MYSWVLGKTKLETLTGEREGHLRLDFGVMCDFSLTCVGYWFG